MKIKKGDIVALITGSDKDRYNIDKKGNKVLKTGQVVRVYQKTEKVVVEGLNIVKKHERPTKEGEKGQIVEVPAPIHISNVGLVDPKTGQITRVGYKFVNGIKVRYAKKSGELIQDEKTKKALKKAEKEVKPKKEVKEKATKEVVEAVQEEPVVKPSKKKAKGE
jgi:large subunit ribosomal protein L24